jgi:hypothetical protein
MRGFHNSSFDPQTLVVLEAAFDEAWLTLKSIGNKTVKPDELARCVLRLAMEGERDPVRLHDGALKGLLPATAWREAGCSHAFHVEWHQECAANTASAATTPPASVPISNAQTNGIDLRKACRIDRLRRGMVPILGFIFNDSAEIKARAGLPR